VAEPGTPVDFDFEAIKHLAASALAEAKKTGRNRCVFKTLHKLSFEQAG